jgi:hypothetical protein
MAALTSWSRPGSRYCIGSRPPTPLPPRSGPALAISMNAHAQPRMPDARWMLAHGIGRIRVGRVGDRDPFIGGSGR